MTSSSPQICRNFGLPWFHQLVNIWARASIKSSKYRKFVLFCRRIHLPVSVPVKSLLRPLNDGYFEDGKLLNTVSISHQIIRDHFINFARKGIFCGDDVIDQLLLHLSVCLSVCPSVRPSVRPSVWQCMISAIALPTIVLQIQHLVRRLRSQEYHCPTEPTAGSISRQYQYRSGYGIDWGRGASTGLQISKQSEGENLQRRGKQDSTATGHQHRAAWTHLSR